MKNNVFYTSTVFSLDSLTKNKVVKNKSKIQETKNRRYKRHSYKALFLDIVRLWSRHLAPSLVSDLTNAMPTLTICFCTEFSRQVMGQKC